MSIFDLPIEMLEKIAGYIDYLSFINFVSTCTLFRSIRRELFNFNTLLPISRYFTKELIPTTFKEIRGLEMITEISGNSFYKTFKLSDYLIDNNFNETDNFYRLTVNNVFIMFYPKSIILFSLIDGDCPKPVYPKIVNVENSSVLVTNSYILTKNKIINIENRGVGDRLFDYKNFLFYQWNNPSYQYIEVIYFGRHYVRSILRFDIEKKKTVYTRKMSFNSSKVKAQVLQQINEFFINIKDKNFEIFEILDQFIVRYETYT